MNNGQRTTRVGASCAAGRACLALAFVIALGACGSTAAATAVSNEPGEPAEVSSIDSPAPEWTLDQSMAFARPVEPFEGDVIAVLDDDMVKVFAESSAELLGSHSVDTQPWALRTSYQHGAVYVTSETSDSILQISRIDAGGIETLQFDRRGFAEHSFDTPVASLTIRTDDYAELVRFQLDGQIDRYMFDSGIFIEVTGDALVLGDNNYSGDMWVMDQELSVVDALNVGQVINRPGLMNSDTVGFSTSEDRYEMDLDTRELTTLRNYQDDPTDPLRGEFGDGWAVQADDGVVEFLNPDGEVVNEVSTEPIQQVRTFEHPTENIVLVVLRTCEKVEGNTCSTTEAGTEDVDDSSGNDDVSDESDEVSDEPYVPPSFIQILQFDMDDASIAEFDNGRPTSIAAMAVDSGWMTATVDGSATNISTISRNGDLEALEEIAISNDFTMGFVEPVGSQSLGFADWQTSEIAVLTDDGVQMIDGQPLTNQQAWRAYIDRFAHVG